MLQQAHDEASMPFALDAGPPACGFATHG
jgi:hypothetical protein